MKLYLDNSFLNRPFDDLAIGLNKSEAQALLLIIDLARRGSVTLVNSALIEYENAENPFLNRRLFVMRVMGLATIYQAVDWTIEERATIIMEEMNLQPIDAAHIAAAEVAQVDFFITCDYTVVKRYRGAINVTTPLLFVYGHKNHRT